MYDISLEEVFEYLDEVIEIYSKIISRLSKEIGLGINEFQLILDSAPYYFNPLIQYSKNGCKVVLEISEVRPKEVGCTLDVLSGEINKSIKWFPHYFKPVCDRLETWYSHAHTNNAGTFSCVIEEVNGKTLGRFSCPE